MSERQLGNREEVAYPPEPWDLHGHAYVGVWLVPKRDAPKPHSPSTKPVSLFGRHVVCAGFFVYEEPSPLTYDEIMATVLVREGWRLRVSITQIWVNSEASRDGGRDLWAIPKGLADFDVATHSSYSAQSIGSMAVRRSRQLPRKVPAAFSVAQDRDGTLLVSPVTGRLHLGLGAARWSFARSGSLGFLAGRKPLLTLVVRPFHLFFGRR